MIKLDVLVAVGSVIADSRRHGCEDASAEPSGYVRINFRIKNANRKHGTTGQWHDSIVSGSTGIKAERISFVLFQVLIRFTSPLQARAPGSAVLRCGLLLSVIPASRCHQVMLLITV